MVSSGTLVVGVLAGAVGTWYFLYGRSQQMAVPMISGILLGVCPYFTNDVFLLADISLWLVVLPFFLRF